MLLQDNDDMKRGERKPFEPTPIELRKQYNTLDAIIRARAGQLKDDLTPEADAERDDTDRGFLPPYNSAY